MKYITAQQAKDTKKDSEVKFTMKSRAQMRRVMKFIKAAVAYGKDSVTYDRILYPVVKNKLEKLGYRVMCGEIFWEN